MKEKIRRIYESEISSRVSRLSFDEVVDEDSGDILAWSCHGDDWEVQVTKMTDRGYAVLAFNQTGSEDIIGRFKTGEAAFEAAWAEARRLVIVRDEVGANTDARLAALAVVQSDWQPPVGVETEGWTMARGGSWYMVAKIGDREYKLTIRDHDVSPFRAKEFGAPDWVRQVSKEWNPDEVEKAIKDATLWLQKKIGAE